MPESAERVAEIVKEALEHDPAERTRVVEAACNGDTGLRREVESLLRHSSEVSGFIETPGCIVDPVELAAEPTAELRPGDVITQYRIESLLGAGGMGEVYLAYDTQLHRRVAIKLVRPGVATRSIIRRFQHEERILASLNHPSIARLCGGGVTKQGLPYFVMEYVEGERLDVYCSRNQLATEARLQLFQKICGAVSYAHQHLVIHRDLKPANISVTADSEPKLLDFGIAKLLNAEPELAGLTVTMPGLMTREYASPEQVRGETVSTASDVYSLGVILCELLTGEKRGGTEPAVPNQQSQKSLRGDLEKIVLMATRAEPERRYSSVTQFSYDLQRYLEGHAVMARKDTLRYRAIKFIARNRIAVAAAALMH